MYSRIGTVAVMGIAALIAGCGQQGPQDRPTLQFKTKSSYLVAWKPLPGQSTERLDKLVSDLSDPAHFLELEQQNIISIRDIFEIPESNKRHESASATGEETAIEQQNTLSSAETCSSFPQWASTRKTGKSQGDYLVPSKMRWDVSYSPGCESYPCTRTAKGEPSHVLTGDGMTVDFYWSDGGSWNYWTSEYAKYFWSDWSVSLYSGSASINYLEKLCTTGTAQLTLSWK